MTTANERGGQHVVTVLRRPLSQDCALPGGYTSGAYSAGWQRILRAFEHTIAEETA